MSGREESGEDAYRLERVRALAPSRRVELDVKGDPHGGWALDLRANSLLPLPMRCRMLGDVRVWRWHS